LVGTIPFLNRQIIVRDDSRYLVWDDYLQKENGSRADFVIGQSTDSVRLRNYLAYRSLHTIDDYNRLWAYAGDGKIIIYQLPFRTGSQPLAISVKLYWQDQPNTEVDYSSFESGIAFDEINKAIWVVDRRNHRLLRVRNYSQFATKLYVDAVIGQPDKNHTKCNHNQEEPWLAAGVPTASSLCHPYAIEFDKLGNLYVVENTYECHGNNRITVFLAEDIRSINSLFPNLQAKKVFISRSFTERATCCPHYSCRWRQNEPESPVSIAFNSRNQMVVGNDGYYPYHSIRERHWRQLWFYSDPLRRNPNGSFVQGQKPDAYIRLPMGAAGEIHFDSQDNLVIQDHTWAKVWVINLERDPSWLIPVNQ